jgi:hypothetical protein
MLKKEINEDFRRWKDIPCLCLGSINVVKLAILQKAIYRFTAIHIKISMTLFTDIKKNQS